MKKLTLTLAALPIALFFLGCDDMYEDDDNDDSIVQVGEKLETGPDAKPVVLMKENENDAGISFKDDEFIKKIAKLRSGGKKIAKEGEIKSDKKADSNSCLYNRTEDNGA